MSFGAAIAAIQAFSQKSSPSAFPNLGVSRKKFAHDLMERINSASLLNQGATSLCGATVFLLAVLRRDPVTFARYVMDLYDRGEAKVGDLSVTPGRDCRSYRPSPSDVSPVEWVALAGLRDSSNAMLDYDSASVEAGGITLPATLAGWFRSANFRSVVNRTNLYFDSDLKTLLMAEQQYSSGAHVCLFIGANLLSGQLGGTTIPDHWVGLATPIRIDGKSALPLLTRGAAINDDATLAKASIAFDVFSWGESNFPVQKWRPNLTVETCIDYFYGFVAAK